MSGVTEPFSLLMPKGGHSGVICLGRRTAERYPVRRTDTSTAPVSPKGCTTWMSNQAQILK